MEYRSPMRVACIALAMWFATGCAGEGPAMGTIPARLGRDNDTQAVYVHEVREAGSDAGLEPDDEIVMIDGMYVRTMSSEELEAKLHGPVGSPVTLTVARGNRVVRVELKRIAFRGGTPNLKPAEKHTED
jgi:C-terminal processing protease CtpA/Prc